MLGGAEHRRTRKWFGGKSIQRSVNPALLGGAEHRRTRKWFGGKSIQRSVNPALLGGAEHRRARKWFGGEKIQWSVNPALLGGADHRRTRKFLGGKNTQVVRRKLHPVEGPDSDLAFLRMLWLPRLTLPAYGVVDLPLASGSALALADLWLAARGGLAPQAAIVSALELDPGLALWTLIRGGAGKGAGECSAQSLAILLRDHSLEWLQGPADSMAGPRSECRQVDADLGADCIRLASRAVARARLARDLAVGPETEDAGRAYMAALLFDAQKWLRLGAPAVASDEALAAAWAGLDHPAARQAEQLLNEESPISTQTGSPPAEEQILQPSTPIAGESGARGRQDGTLTFGQTLGALRQGAADACERHFRPGGAEMTWLPDLAARLARLKVLEERFSQQLELEKLESMAEFAAGAGHEINNPLAVIAGRAQLLMRDERRLERRRDLALMNGQAMRVHEMIADMMLFARPPQPRRASCDATVVVGQVVDSLRDKAQECGARLEYVPPAGPLWIHADDRQLSVAVRACLDNALRAAAGGVVRVGAQGSIGGTDSAPHGGRDASDGVQIWIEDDGPGIPPEVRRHLFDPYFSGRQSGRGLGLGLAKCWRIVTNHGGRIDVQSEPGVATRFTIWLPRDVPHAAPTVSP